MTRINSSMTRYPPGSGHPRLLSLLLAAMLLLMQTLILQHQIDLDHHNDNEHCELCLHISPLDHAVTTSYQSLEAIPPIMVEPTALPVSKPARLNRPYQTRAPPSLS